jgi:hypothetical protein
VVVAGLPVEIYREFLILGPLPCGGRPKKLVTIQQVTMNSLVAKQGNKITGSGNCFLGNRGKISLKR